MKIFKKRKNKVYPNREARRGFVILFSVMLSSIVLAIALGISNTAVREINFGTSAREAGDAFFAADTGAECALANDKSGSVSFTVSGSSGTVFCLGGTIATAHSSAGNLHIWDFAISGLGGGNDSCARVRMTKDFTDPSAPITIMSSKGYNNGGTVAGACTQSATSLERELELRY